MPNQRPQAKKSQSPDSSIKPQLSEAEERGQFGENYVRQIVQSGWRSLVQDMQGINDRGIDFVVQDVHDGRLTSIQFAIQVKTSAFTKKFAGRYFPAPVEERHLAFWRDSTLPVVIVCVDVTQPRTIAYWQLIEKDSSPSIQMDKQRVFEGASRDAVIAALRRGIPPRLPLVSATPLYPPLKEGFRPMAKAYYLSELLGRSVRNELFGPVEFTWKGWKHLTRQSRSGWRIQGSLTLLPAVRPLLQSGAQLWRWRSLPSISRGRLQLFRTLLVFSGTVILSHRAPAVVRIVVEAQATIPTDTAQPVRPGERRVRYIFLSVWEMGPKETGTGRGGNRPTNASAEESTVAQ
jgi:hypothetical protein